MTVNESKNRCRKYTLSDDQYILENYKTQTYKEMGKHLGRSYDSVYARLKLLGINKTRGSVKRNKNGEQITYIHKPSLCWECGNAIPSEDRGCSWSRSFKPVDGWDATLRVIRMQDRSMDSYCVNSCPEFVRG